MRRKRRRLQGRMGGLNPPLLLSRFLELAWKALLYSTSKPAVDGKVRNVCQSFHLEEGQFDMESWPGVSLQHSFTQEF